MNERYNVSSSPHTRSKLTTGSVMLDVLISLLPATILGIWNFGLEAVMVIAVAVVSAVLTEFVFDLITKRPNTVKDGSAAVTGLLLALVLPSSVPYYVPLLGSVFAILVVKCIFGGLGKNFMNPALAGRCFLLASFSGTVTKYTLDGVVTATPLVDMAGGTDVSLWNIFIGNTSGVIGCSIAGLLIGAVYLLVTGGITWEIPVSAIAVFAVYTAIFGGQGLDFVFILKHICAGGLILGAIFMATDPVTSPVTGKGQLIYGALVGLLCAMFRFQGSAADSVSYAIIISNLVTPLIDEFIIPKPFAFRASSPAGEKKKFPVMPAIILCVITLIAGLALGAIYNITKDKIAAQEEAAKIAAFQEVVPDASEFTPDETATEAIDALAGEVFGTDFSKSYINEANVGLDASGNIVGCVISVTSKDAYDGDLTLAVGFDNDGTINAISYTDIHETAGMGMLCDGDTFKDQFIGKNVDSFKLNMAGGSTGDNEIDGVSGCTYTSSASVNAVNAAISFFKDYVKQ